MTRPLPQKSAGSVCEPGMLAVVYGPPLTVMTDPGPVDRPTVVDGPVVGNWVTRSFVGWAEVGTSPLWQTGGGERQSGYG